MCGLRPPQGTCLGAGPHGVKQNQSINQFFKAPPGAALLLPDLAWPMPSKSPQIRPNRARCTARLFWISLIGHSPSALPNCDNAITPYSVRSTLPPYKYHLQVSTELKAAPKAAVSSMRTYAALPRCQASPPFAGCEACHAQKTKVSSAPHRCHWHLRKGEHP